MTLPNFENQNMQLPTFERHNMQSPNLQLQSTQPAHMLNVQMPNFEGRYMQSDNTSNNFALLRRNFRSEDEPDQRRSMQAQVYRQNMPAARRSPVQENEIELFKRSLNSPHPQQWIMPRNSFQQRNFPYSNIHYQNYNEQTLDLSYRSTQEPNIPPIDVSGEERGFENQLNRLMASWNSLPYNVRSYPESLPRTSTLSSPSNATFPLPEYFPRTSVWSSSNRAYSSPENVSSTWGPLTNRIFSPTEYLTTASPRNVSYSSLEDVSEESDGN